MPGAVGPFPPDWVTGAPGSPSSDLDLVVLLVNTHDLLDDPPDRLHDLRWLVEALGAVGHAALATELEDDDLPALRRLRDRLRLVFETDDDAEAAGVLNPLLVRAGAVPVLVPGTGLVVAPDRTGRAALEARLPAALAAYVAERGARRLGTCAGDPCACAYVDRTRASTRRFCCSICNDRAAARSYRAKKRAAAG